MTKHLLTLVWNRRRANALVVLEIFISFLVLFAAVTLGAYYADNYRRPLGYSYENVWDISVGSLMEMISGDSAAEDKKNITKRLLAALREFPEIEASAGMDNPLFSIGTSNNNYYHQGRKTLASFCAVTDGFQDVMRLELVRGRWFEAADDALDWDPVIINQRLANELFGSEDPLGKNIGNPEEKRQARVVGIITEYRENGELFEPENYVVARRKLTGVSDDAMLHIVIRVRPGTTAAFEETVMTRLLATARGTSFEIKPLAQVRASFMRVCMAPLLAIGVVAAFLMIMVSLGLVGVVWQSVTQRTTEIGLRRALGGTATAIHAQVLGELVVITSVGLLLGTALVAQLPLLGVMTFVGTRVFLVGLGTSLALIYLLTLLCGLYPSMLASKIQPAEALHYE